MRISAAQVSMWSHLGLQSHSVRKFDKLSEIFPRHKIPLWRGQLPFPSMGFLGNLPFWGASFQQCDSLAERCNCPFVSLLSAHYNRSFVLCLL